MVVMSPRSAAVFTTVVILLTILPTFGLAWVIGDNIPMTYQLKINGTTALAKKWLSLPIDFSPRFGVNKHVVIPSLDYGSHEKHVSIRFKLERGLEKMTKWLLIKRTIQLDESLVLKKEAEIRQKMGHIDSTTLDKLRAQIGKETHMERVVFVFGYQGGVFNRMTDFHVYASFTTVPQTAITLEYKWHEHRRFNPHRALSAAYIISLLAVLVIVHRLLTTSVLPLGENGKTRKMVVIDTRAE